MPGEKRSRNDYELSKKREIIYFSRENPKLKQIEIKNHFENKWNIIIGKSTLSEILNNQEKYLTLESVRTPNTKRLRAGEYPQLEQCLYLWLIDKVKNAISVSDAIIIKQAKVFGPSLGISDLEFSYSQGWLEKFKTRYNVRNFTKQGEEGSVDLKVVEDGRKIIGEKIKKYSLDDVFNFDETALFYKLQPNKTLATGSVSGNKLSKERLTVALCVNATGSYKCKPLVIGKAKKPQCFGNLWKPDDYVRWYNNIKAWMTMDIFKDWLHFFNNQMKSKNKKVILLIDNAGGHNTPNDLNLSNVELLYLPANTTSKLQPLDAGIIKNFKVIYKNFLVDKYLQDIEKINKIELPNVKEAILMIKKSWDMVKTSTISNCWHHCGFLDNHSLKNDGDDLAANISKIKIKLKDINQFKSQTDESSIDLITEEFISIDENECIESLTDDEILLIVKNSDTSEVIEESEAESYNIPPEQISFEDVRQSFDTILTFFNNRKYDEDEMKQVTKFKSFLENVFISNRVQMKLSFTNTIAYD